jgi:predicted alpha/beta superfamily hydrolase
MVKDNGRKIVHYQADFDSGNMIPYKTSRFLALVLACGALPGPALADSGKPLPLSRTNSEVPLTSAQGRSYRLLISVPNAPAPAKGYPVLYVLDGDGWFGPAVDIVRMREYEKLAPAIVVGVGYPSHAFFDAEGRSYDFTLPGSADPDFDGIKLGGADEFLSFLTDTLKPWVKAHYKVDPNTQILFGHSLGGSFVLHALFKVPESFNVFLAASPDIPFAKRIALKEEPAFEANPARTTPRVMVTVGSLESHPSPALMDDYRRYFTRHPEAIPGETVDQVIAEMFTDKSGYDKADDTQQTTDRLAKSGVHATFVEFDGEEHMSAAISALNRGIPFALRPAP